jgi:hypothetical protein
MHELISRTYRTAILILILILAAASYCSAGTYEDPHIKIYAQSLTYNKARGVYEAIGDVSIKIDDYRISGIYAKYFPATSKLVVEDQLIMEIDAYRVSASRLEFDVKKKEGSAMIVRINYGENFLGGSFMRIDEDKFDILNAYFTGCNRPDSDYHTASTELIFYPKTGTIIGYWGIFWIGSVPTIPVPTFVYSAPVPELPVTHNGPAKPHKKYISRKRDVFPISGIGNNKEDGTIFVQPFDYYFGPQNYMRTHASWTEKKNLGAATAINYNLWTDRNEGEIRAGTNGVDGTYGGLTHIFSAGPRLLSPEEDKKYVYDKYFIGNKYLTELEVNYSLRERINIYKNEGPFNRVSFLPKVSLRANRNNFLNEDFTYFAETNFALISEEALPSNDGVGGAKGKRVQMKGDVTYGHGFWILGNFSAKCDIDLKTYLDERSSKLVDSWRTATQNLSLSQDWYGILETSFGHRHIFMNAGHTPYEFEGYWFSPYDTLMTSAKLNILSSFITFDGQYDLPSKDWRSLKYGLSLGMHCYNIVAAYELNKDLEGNEASNFIMTVELAPSRW